MYGYIYLTTNTVNGKMYIGQKASSLFVESYKGSGTLIKKAFLKYGWENFKVEVLEWCSNQDELDAREIYWINFYDAVNSNNFYNLQSGGSVGCSKKGSKRSERFKSKVTGENNPFYGKVHSETTKRQISKTVSSQFWITNGIVERKATVETFSYFEKEGYVRGRLPLTLEAKQHMSVAAKNHSRESIERARQTVLKRYADKRNHPMYGRHLSDEWKQHLSESHKGKKASEQTKQLLSKQRLGRRWINNGKEQKFCKPDEVEFYISNGWVFGCLPKDTSSETIETVPYEKDIRE